MDQLIKILTYHIRVQIQSSPIFIIETGIQLFIIVCHCLLITQIDKAINSLNTSLIKVKRKNSAPSVANIKKDSNLKVEDIFKENAYVESQSDLLWKINKLLSRTCSQYVTWGLKSAPSSKKSIGLVKDEMISASLIELIEE